MTFPIPSTTGVQKALGLAAEPTYIDKGGFKAVYRFATEDGGEEALKAVFVPPVGNEEDELRREQLVARAKREIAALGECASPHLVKLGGMEAALRTIEGNDYLMYSEELLPGQALHNWIGQQPAPDYSDLREVFTSLIALIRELSEREYLHRDIKPENIMDTGDASRRFVMLDLGIAYKMHGTDLTRAGSPPGTLRYMAPELLQPDYKDNMDFRCDLYAAGLTVYVLATGSHPFAPRPEADFATVQRIMKTSPGLLETLRSDLPVDFCRIIDRCIKKKPALRYANLDLVEKALNEVAP